MENNKCCWKDNSYMEHKFNLKNKNKEEIYKEYVKIANETIIQEDIFKVSPSLNVALEIMDMIKSTDEDVYNKILDTWTD